MELDARMVRRYFDADEYRCQKDEYENLPAFHEKRNICAKITKMDRIGRIIENKNEEVRSFIFSLFQRL